MITHLLRKHNLKYVPLSLLLILSTTGTYARDRSGTGGGTAEFNLGALSFCSMHEKSGPMPCEVTCPCGTAGHGHDPSQADDPSCPMVNIQTTTHQDVGMYGPTVGNGAAAFASQVPAGSSFITAAAGGKDGPKGAGETAAEDPSKRGAGDGAVRAGGNAATAGFREGSAGKAPTTNFARVSPELGGLTQSGPLSNSNSPSSAAGGSDGSATSGAKTDGETTSAVVAGSKNGFEDSAKHVNVGAGFGENGEAGRSIASSSNSGNSSADAGAGGAGKSTADSIAQAGQADLFQVISKRYQTWSKDI